ncbi:MAG: hypothetical protein CM15mV12_0580 [uncultured marine virus]|nr:MAG: hypothetical protein CM15mV12_0580 [uncultured marine virus]
MKSLNDFIEEAAKSVERPKCPEGSYYDPIKKKCVKMTTKYGRDFMAEDTTVTVTKMEMEMGTAVTELLTEMGTVRMVAEMVATVVATVAVVTVVAGAVMEDKTK